MWEPYKDSKDSRFNNFDKSSLVYQKYLKRYDPKAPENAAKIKKDKAEKRKSWWAQNWLSFLGVVFAAIAAIPVIIQGIETILKLLK